MNLFIQNKYTKWYFLIIKKAKSQKRKKKCNTYYERHHIIPKSIVKNNDTVLLTAREHYICHLLLTKMCIDTKHKGKMFYALWRLLLRSNKFHKRNYVVPSRIYEYCKKEQASITSDKLRGKNPVCAGWNVGKNHSDETRKRISVGRKGIKTGSRPNIKLLALAKKGIPDKVVGCPYCEVTGGNSIMKRWHFDNCKKKGGEVVPT